ncbi:MAG: hypothetical protein ACRC3B_07875, partial [Bacteroidia bacterium]
MSNKKANTGKGRTVFLLAVDFRRQSKTKVTADVQRQFETCSYYASTHNLNLNDSSVISHLHLLNESEEFT